MNVGNLVEELQTYDQTLPVVLGFEKGGVRGLSYNDLVIKDNVIVNHRTNRTGKALLITTY